MGKNNVLLRFSSIDFHSLYVGLSFKLDLHVAVHTRSLFSCHRYNNSSNTLCVINMNNTAETVVISSRVYGKFVVYCNCVKNMILKVSELCPKLYSHLSQFI